MKKILILAKRELFSYFTSPLAFITLTCFLILNGIIFWMITDLTNRPESPYGAVMRLFFGGTIFYWLFLFIFIPVITMKLFSEEIKSGSIELLMTSPVKEFQIVLGKYLGAALFYIFLWTPTIIYPVILNHYTSIDFGPVVSGYAGSILTGLFFISIGMFCSAVTKSQVSSAILSFAVIACVFLSGLLSGFFMDPTTVKFFDYINAMNYMETFGKGIIDSRAIAYLVSCSAGIIFLNIRYLETRKWL